MIAEDPSYCFFLQAEKAHLKLIQEPLKEKQFLG